MDPIFQPLSKEQKEALNSKGYREWEYPYWPKWCDPDEKACKLL